MSENVKRLTRSRDDRWLAGICGGIGQYFNLDPTLIRALFVLFGLVVGGGLILYIILWIIIPLEPDPTAPRSEEISASEDESVT
jgi:phage shock protein C